MHLTTVSSTNVSQNSLTFLRLFHYTAITTNCRYFATDVAVNEKSSLCFVGHLSTMRSEVELGTTCWSNQRITPRSTYSGKSPRTPRAVWIVGRKLRGIAV